MAASYGLMQGAVVQTGRNDGALIHAVKHAASQAESGVIVRF